MPDRHDLTPSREQSPAPAAGPQAEETKPLLAAASEALEAEAPKAAEAEADFMDSFFAGMDETPAPTAESAGATLREEEMQVSATAVSLEAAKEASREDLAFSPEATRDHLLEASPVVAQRDLRQLFPVKSAEAALALAAMPHYEIGGQASVRVGQMEMRWLAAEAKTTLADTTPAAIQTDEDGDRLVKGHLVEHHEAVAAEAEATIQSLVDAGYLRPVRLSADEARGQVEINAVLQGELPEDWRGLAADVDTRLAYEMTDAGIAAGRSLRGWDGQSLEAGLVRLPDAEPMPAIVASESYALSAMLMENRSMAGVLHQGEMGAFYRAEIQNVEYGMDHGADPVVTAGRLDSVVNSASFVALEQIEERVAPQDAPLTTADLVSVSEASHRILDKLPEAVLVRLPEEGQEWMSLDKAQSRVLLARLDGVRMGAELIAFEKELGAIRVPTTSGQLAEVSRDRRAEPAAWENSIRVQGDNLAIRNALAVAKGWLSQAAVKGDELRKEVLAMATGAFGDRGTAMAKQILEAA